MITVDFATFCHAKDKHRLYHPDQLRLQVERNNFDFNSIVVVHQVCDPGDFGGKVDKIVIKSENQILDILDMFMNLDKPQYESPDTNHLWHYHVINHLFAAMYSEADYIVFADSDCWMVEQPANESWVTQGIKILQSSPNAFIVSPNDGEVSRTTQRISQQMFMVNRKDFLAMDFNQPGYTGNPRDYDTMPEYHAMLEGRIGHYCMNSGRYRAVLGPEYRYWHHNRLDENDLFETDRSKY